MQQMYRYWITGFFLFVCSWQDIRRKKLSGELFLLFGIGAIIVDIFYQTSIWLCITAMLPGLILLAFGKISEQQIGYGDGFAVMVMGLLLPGRETVAVLLFGFFLCALGSVGLFFSGKWKRKMAVPFVPFLTAAYVLLLLPEWTKGS